MSERMNGKFSVVDLNNRVFERHEKLGADAREIIATAIRAVDPYHCVMDQIHISGQQLIIGEHEIPLVGFERIFLLGFGKAAVPMARAVLDIIDTKIYRASVITKDAKFRSAKQYHGKLVVYLGGHPVPTEESLQSTKALLQNLPELKENDLVLVLISGGGSALFTDPVPGVTLEDLQKITRTLIKSGAGIQEINTLRKHLDQIKGGRLALKLQPAHVVSLVLSDVIGDRLDMIASGPLIPDPTTYQDALDILGKYDIEDLIPDSVIEVLKKGVDGAIPETLKPGAMPPGKVYHHLVGTNFLAAEAARCCAENLGYHAIIITTALTGLTDSVAEFLEGILVTQIAHDHPARKPACLILGGEPTVNVLGDGLGGRNMDLTLKMVPRLAGKPGVLFISVATDGEDGPTDSAGAVADAWVLTDGKDVFGLDVSAYAENHDSYHYFKKVGGLIKTGATGTNVNDLVIMLIGKQ